MKKINILISIILLFTLASCSKSWLDVNTDPNNPEIATPELVLPSAEVSLASVIGGNYNILGGMWSQYWTQSPSSNQYKNIDGYHLLNSDFQDQWREMYTGTLKNLRFVREQALLDKNNSYVFMATTLECYTYQVLADLYDQCPMNEALHGEDQKNINPKYDNAITVYDSIASRMEKVFSLNLSVPLTAAQKSKDLIFKGDMGQWNAFANTLLLKIYMRQMYVRPTLAQAGIAALYARNAEFLTTDAKLDIFVDEPNKDNPLYESDRRALNTGVNIRSSATLFKYLNYNNDARLFLICGPGPDGKLNPKPVPNPQGDYSQFYPASYLATISVAVIKPTDPVYYMSAAESYFLQAEAVAKGWGTGNNQTLYKAGVTAAFAKYGLRDTATYYLDSIQAPFYANYKYPPADTTFEVKQEAIIMQKWISMAGSEGIESFFETNRTHFPKTTSITYVIGGNNDAYNAWNGGELMYSVDGSTGGLFPKRLLFTNTERTTNPNCPAEQPITKKVWWDTK